MARKQANGGRLTKPLSDFQTGCFSLIKKSMRSIHQTQIASKPQYVRME